MIIIVLNVGQIKKNVIAVKRVQVQIELKIILIIPGILKPLNV